MPTTITAYTFDELSPEAQERALESLPFEDCEDTASECVDSLRAFAEKVSRSCGVSLKDWNIGDSRSSFTRWDMEDSVRELTGPRSLAWVENNVFALIRQSWRPATAPINEKWASVHGRYSRRYYKPGELKACPYTGVCFDEDILDAFRDKDLTLTIGERFDSIGDRLSRVIEADIEYKNSAEGRRENADFYFDGALFDAKGKRLS